MHCNLGRGEKLKEWKGWVCSFAVDYMYHIIVIKKLLHVLKEALTPVKNQATCIEEDEAVELTAFDKVLLECDQEGPVKFTEFLDLRFVTSTVIVFWPYES